ncbi:hypothetical protein [Viridibacillus arvi]|uniref:hypothetical protein n=1 Tax=Viridibacillus arvi TaxID=263475 RepID=UPI0034CE3878
MKHITEEQLRLCQQYLNTVFGIEEGFEYVKASFTDFSKTEGDLVLSDIIQSFFSIAQTNILLERLFIDDEKIQQGIKQFKEVTEAAFMLEGHFDHYDTKVKVVNDNLYPTFFAWSESIQVALSRNVTQ